MDMLTWAIENKAWLFSGAGVAIIAAIVRWMLRKPSHAQQSGGTGSQNIQAQAGRDLNITLDALPPIRQTHEVTERADDVLASMPQLVSEMRSDLLAPGAKFTREFFLVPNRNVCLWSGPKPRFIYYEDDHQNLRGQIDLLEAQGFLTNVTPVGNNAPIYRMTEKLVSSLCNDTCDE
jgi:hypothetical protein